MKDNPLPYPPLEGWMAKHPAGNYFVEVVTKGNYDELRKELADQREKVKTLLEALEGLPEQLLESQRSNPAWSKSELWGIERDIVPSLRLLINTALAKVKQEK
jgi:hypothetical protein